MLRDAPENDLLTQFAYEEPIPAPNYPRMIWQRKLLILMGVVLGAMGGYWYNSRQPANYRSTAKFQLVKPNISQIPVDGIESRGFGGTDSESDMAEQAMIMRSEVILARAAALGKLGELEPFSGQSSENIGFILSNSGSFTVKSLGPTTYEVGYTSGSPDAPKRVLDAVSDAYAEHLAEQQDLIGEETLNLIEDARGEVLNRLETLEANFDKFKRSTPLIHRGEDMGSIHRDYAEQYLQKRQELTISRTQLESKLQAAKEAIAQRENTESILLLLTGDAADEVQEILEPFSSGEGLDLAAATNPGAKDDPEVVPGLSRAESTRQETLFPLQLQEKELLLEVGPNHPSVLALQSQIRIVEAQIVQIEQSEAEYNRQLKKLMEQRAGQARDQADSEASEKERQEMVEKQQRDQIRLMVLAMQQQKRLIDNELQVVDQAYEFETAAMADERAAEVEHDRMTREIERQQNLYDRIVSRLDEIKITSEAAGIRIVPLAKPRVGAKVTDVFTRSLILGVLIGLGLMVGLSVLLGVTDKAYHSAEEIAEHLKSPVIGHVPYISNTQFRTKLPPKENSILDHTLHTYHNPKKSASEAYKSIRTALFFSDQGGSNNLVQVTSAAPGEGKSTVAANIAIAMSQAGKNVLLLDADLRRPRVEKLFGIDVEKGVAWAIDEIAMKKDQKVGFDLIAEAVTETEVPNLSVMTAGTKPDNPSELLTSKAFETFLSLVRDKFDAVVVDSPPLLAVTDPSNIVPRVDGVIMVVRLGKQARPRAAQANRMLETLGANTLGVVVNGVGAKQAGYYGRYGYRDGYYNRKYYRSGYGYSYGYSYENSYNEYYDESKKKRKGFLRKGKADVEQEATDPSKKG